MNEKLDEKILKNIAGGEGEELVPKYNVYDTVEYDYEGHISIGKIRQVGTNAYGTRIKYTVECRYVSQGVVSIYEEDIRRKV